jgi:hypothetical protein
MGPAVIHGGWLHCNIQVVCHPVILDKIITNQRFAE